MASLRSAPSCSASFLPTRSIALSSTLLARAALPSMPLAATLAGALATPFQPFLVTAVNGLATEVAFLRRASARPDSLRLPQLLHSTAAGLGLACFFLEDVAPRLPCLHATWHLLSAVSIGTTNALLRDVEEQQQQQCKRRQSDGGVLGASRPLLLPTAAVAAQHLKHERDWVRLAAGPISVRQLAPVCDLPC